MRGWASPDQTPVLPSSHCNADCSRPRQYRQWVTALATGTLTFTDLRKFFRTKQSGDRRRWPVLLDATAANTNMTGAEAERLAVDLTAALSQTGPRGPIAIIATDDILSGLLRICRMVCNKRGMNFCVCRRRSTAERWLTLTLNTS